MILSPADYENDNQLSGQGREAYGLAPILTLHDSVLGQDVVIVELDTFNDEIRFQSPKELERYVPKTFTSEGELTLLQPFMILYDKYVEDIGEAALEAGVTGAYQARGYLALVEVLNHQKDAKRVGIAQN